MKTLLIIAIVAIIVIVLKACTSGAKMGNDLSRPDSSKKPTVQKSNDKIIAVYNANHNDIKEALVKFCNIYNKNDYAALPRLWQLSSDSFAITFPYDIDFVTYCFAINFFKYPIDIKNWNAQVYGWATTHTGDDWITEKSINKKVMLYLSKDDKEYDNVFLTTQDNIGYKLGFAAGREKQLLSSPEEMYIAPKVEIESLTSTKYEDFE